MISLTPFLIVLQLLLPGYAWILASGLHKQISTLEKGVLSFVLSFCFSSLLTAALTFLTANYLLLSVAISLAGSLLIVVGYVAKRKQSLLHPHSFSLSTGSRLLDFSILAYVILILGLFWSAPYYPTAQAPDLLTHTLVTKAIITGEGRSTLLHANFPIGLHFVAAITSSLVGVGALQALRILASTLLLATVPLVYLSARELLGTAKSAGMAVLVAAFAMPVDAIHLFHTGTFPNLASDAIILAVVWLAFRYVKQPSFPLGITLVLLGVGGTFTHSSFLIFLAVLWIMTLVALVLFRDRARNLVQAAGYCTVGLAIFALFASFSFSSNLQRVVSSYFLVGMRSVFRIAFAEFTRELLLFLGPVSLVAVVCAAFFALKYQRRIGVIFSFLWLVFMMPGAFLSGQEYRFIFFAMLPASLLVGYMLAEAPSHLTFIKGSLLSRLAKTAVVLILLLLIVSGTLPSIAVQAFNPSGRNFQSAVYDSMVWVQHSSCSAGVASLGLWPDYEYLPALTGVQYVGDFIRSPDYVLQKSTTLSFHCLVASKTNQYFPQYESNPAFQEKYQNELITVFVITYD